jgi:hypothetical protein
VNKGACQQLIMYIKRYSNPVTGPVVAQRVGGGIALLLHDLGSRRG